MNDRNNEFDLGALIEGQKWIKSALIDMKENQNARHLENKDRLAGLEEHIRQVEHDGKGTRTAMELVSEKVKRVEGSVEEMKVPVALFNSYTRRTKWIMAGCGTVLLGMMMLVHYINDVWELVARVAEGMKK